MAASAEEWGTCRRVGYPLWEAEDVTAFLFTLLSDQLEENTSVVGSRLALMQEWKTCPTWS